MGGIWSAVFCFGGKTGIRTLGTVARSPHFECGDRPLRHLSLFGGQSYNFFVIRERKVPKKYGEIVR